MNERRKRWLLDPKTVVDMNRTAYDIGEADSALVWKELRPSELAWRHDQRPCHHDGCAICEDRP
jgi:hypothetical protein